MKGYKAFWEKRDFHLELRGNTDRFFQFVLVVCKNGKTIKYLVASHDCAASNGAKIRAVQIPNSAVINTNSIQNGLRTLSKAKFLGLRTTAPTIVITPSLWIITYCLIVAKNNVFYANEKALFTNDSVLFTNDNVLFTNDNVLFTNVNLLCVNENASCANDKPLYANNKVFDAKGNLFVAYFLAATVSIKSPIVKNDCSFDFIIPKRIKQPRIRGPPPILKFHFNTYCPNQAFFCY